MRSGHKTVRGYAVQTGRLHCSFLFSFIRLIHTDPNLVFVHRSVSSNKAIPLRPLPSLSQQLPDFATRPEIHLEEITRMRELLLDVTFVGELAIGRGDVHGFQILTYARTSISIVIPGISTKTKEDALTSETRDRGAQALCRTNMTDQRPIRSVSEYALIFPSRDPDVAQAIHRQAVKYACGLAGRFHRRRRFRKGAAVSEGTGGDIVGECGDLMVAGINVVCPSRQSEKQTRWKAYTWSCGRVTSRYRWTSRGR